jgi:hypothetical protein
VQAQALQAAFPRYRVNTIIKSGRVLFEAVSMDCGNPYCLISSDAKELWHELKAAA